MSLYLSTYECFEDFGHARACAEMAGKKLSFKEWVKTATCHNCGEKGNVKPKCPQTADGRNVRQTGCPRSDTRSSERPGEHLRKFRDSGKLTGDRKKKVFHALQALCDLLGGEDGGEDDAVNEDDAAAAEDDAPGVADDDNVPYQANTVLADKLFNVFEMSKE